MHFLISSIPQSYQFAPHISETENMEKQSVGSADSHLII